MNDEPKPIQEHNMNELSAMVGALPEEQQAEARCYVEGFMDAQLKLYSQNRFAFGLYHMDDAEDLATLNTIEATCRRYGITRTPPEAMD